MRYRTGSSGYCPPLRIILSFFWWVLLSLLVLLAHGDSSVGEPSSTSIRATTTSPHPLVAAGTNSGLRIHNSKNAPPSFLAAGIGRNRPALTPLSRQSATTASMILPRLRRGGGVALRQSNKLANFRERLLPSIILLVGLYILVNQGRVPGVTMLLLLLTPGLYQEAVSVVLPESPTLSWESAFQWWWFVAASLATTIPPAFTALFLDTMNIHPAPICQLISYAMLATGFVVWIYHLNGVVPNNDSAVEQFQTAWNELSVYTMALVFTVVPVSLWMAVLQLEHGLAWALYTALLVIVNDSMAYIFGFTLGKHALLPTISPKKTWEGWCGALISTLVLSVPLWNCMFSGTQDLPYSRHSVIVALFCSLVAPFGGFLASSLKRAGGKKDFGNLIAGHGGLVDRLDCQLLTAPFLYLYVRAMVPAATTP